MLANRSSVDVPPESQSKSDAALAAGCGSALAGAAGSELALIQSNSASGWAGASLVIESRSGNSSAGAESVNQSGMLLTGAGGSGVFTSSSGGSGPVFSQDIASKGCAEVSDAAV